MLGPNHEILEKTAINHIKKLKKKNMFENNKNNNRKYMKNKLFSWKSLFSKANKSLNIYFIFYYLTNSYHNIYYIMHRVCTEIILS